MLCKNSSIALTITNLGDRKRHVVRANPRPVDPAGQWPVTHYTGEYVVSGADLHMCAESYPYGGLKPETSCP
jgi:hypothetical protein